LFDDLIDKSFQDDFYSYPTKMYGKFLLTDDLFLNFNNNIVSIYDLKNLKLVRLKFEDELVQIRKEKNIFIF